MNRLLRSLLLIAMLACLGSTYTAVAQQATPPATEARVAAQSDDQQIEVERDDQDSESDDKSDNPSESDTKHRRSRHGDNVVMHIGDDSSLAAGDTADSVVAIFGSATSAGEVREVVMAIAGDAEATGRVGEAVAAIGGNAYVNSEVGEDVIAIFGNVTLGPNAIVNGEVAAVGGVINRDPAAIVRGPQQQIAFGQSFGGLSWLKPWFKYCLLYGRPLAFEQDVAWAWWLAFGFLGLYVLLALMFDAGMQRCVTTLEERPAQSVIASVLAVLLSPVLIILMMITVIGIALVPFLMLGLFCAGLFGKAVVLGTLGRRITRFTGIGVFSHIAFATLLGGLLVLLLYVVPVIGFIAYNLIGALGLGVVVYTLILSLRVNHPPAAPIAAGAGEPVAATLASDGSTVPPSSPTPPPATPSNIEFVSLPRAGFWIRMGALAIDAILVGVMVDWLEPSGHLFLVALAGYGALMWKLKGTTIGGIVCNLRVVRTDGRDIEWETAIVRALSCFLSLLPAGLGFVWMVFDNNRQTWHDKIAGTVVVRVPRNQPLV